MFKPTLKRSRLTQHEQETPYHNHYDSNHVHQLTAPAGQQANLSIAPSAFIEPTDFHNTGNLGQNQKIVSPLDCWSLAYPQQVKKVLDTDIQEITSRGISCKFGVYWMHRDNSLHLWNYQSTLSAAELKARKHYDFETIIRGVAVGKLNRVASSRYLTELEGEGLLLAIGFQCFIDLYLIDQHSLEIKNLAIRFKVDFKQTLEKMVFTESNELLYTGSGGYLTRVLFLPGPSTKPILKLTPRPSTFSFSLSHLFSPTKTVITEQIVSSTHTDKIYVLLREQQNYNWIQKKLWRLKFSLSGRRRRKGLGSCFVQKRIVVYTKGEGQSLNFLGNIYDYEIERTLLQNYVSVKQSNEISQMESEEGEYETIRNTLVSISLSAERRQASRLHEGRDKSKLNLLAVATKSRHMLLIKEHYSATKRLSFSFIGQPVSLPSAVQSLQQEQQGFGLYGEYRPPTASSKPVYLEYSLGFNNLSFLSNGLCYYLGEHQMQVIKCEGGHRDISEMTVGNVSQWALFSVSQISILKLITIPQILITYFAAQQELSSSKQQGSKRFRDIEQQSSISRQILLSSCRNLMDVFAKISRKRVCQGICELLIYITGNKLGYSRFYSCFRPQRQQTLWQQSDTYAWQTVLINRNLRELARNELEQVETRKSKRMGTLFHSQDEQRSAGVVKFEDWFHQVSQQNEPTDYVLSEQTEDILWRFLYTYEHLVDQHIPSNQHAECGVYWIYLFESVAEILSEIKSWSIQNFCENHSVRDAYKERLKILEIMLKEKEARQSLAIRDLKDLREFVGQKERDRLNKQLHPEINSREASFTTRSSDGLEEELRPEAIPHPSHKASEPIETDTGSGIDLMVKSLKINLESAQSVGNLEGAIKQMVPKLIVSMQLFQLLGEQKGRAPLPTFGDFLLKLSCRKQVKQALIRTFPRQSLSLNEVIIKFNRLLPQLGLQQQLLFEKWFGRQLRTQQPEPTTSSYLKLRRFFGSGPGTSPARPSQVQDRITSSHLERSLKIQNYDYVKIGQKFSLPKIKQLKYLFAEHPQKYVQLLLHRCRAVEADLSTLRGANSIRQQSIQQLSILEADNEKLSKQIEEELSDQRNWLRECISREVRDLARDAFGSKAEQYVVKEKCFDSSIESLFRLQFGQELLDEVVEYLNREGFWIEKVHAITKRLALLHSKETGGALREPKRPELMSTLQLMSSSVSKSQDMLSGMLTNSSMK